MNAIKRNKRFIHSRHDIPFLNDRCCWCGSLFDQHAPHQQAQSDIAFCRKIITDTRFQQHIAIGTGNTNQFRVFGSKDV